MQPFSVSGTTDDMLPMIGRRIARAMFWYATLAFLISASTVSRAGALEFEQSDDFLAGYLTSAIERELGWPRDSFRIEVRHRSAIIIVADNDLAQREAAVRQLRPIAGLENVRVVATASAAPGNLPPVPTSAGRSNESREVTTNSAATVDSNSPDAPAANAAEPPRLAASPLPPGELFSPFLADPRQPQFSASLRHYNVPDDDFTGVAVGFGENFGFYRVTGNDPRDGLQIGIAASVIALFDIDSESNDLINADYTVGIPLTWRSGDISARLQLYHQSSHLGDEFTLRAASDRINLSYEAAEAIASYDSGPYRIYFGGEYLLAREPDDLDRASLHGGFEYRDDRRFFGLGRFVGGIDVKSFEEQDWALDTSIKAGLEFSRIGPGGRSIRLLAEGFRGFSPHGQFYRDRISYYGLGLYFGF